MFWKKQPTQSQQIGDVTIYGGEMQIAQAAGDVVQTSTSKGLTSEAIASLVDHLPEHVKSALEERSIELECPIEVVIEMAIASFLDEEAFSFEDCLLAKRLDKSSPVT
jgi:hypothetical protein